MNDTKKHIEELLHSLKQEREELQVKLHLAKMEATDEWQKLEEKLSKLEAKAKDLGSATAEASQSIGTAAKLLGVETRDGFKKIAKRF